MAASLHPGDVAAIAVYFLVIIAVGIWTTLRKNKGSTTGYFLAGRGMTWLPIGASVYSSNVGAPMFIGLAGTAAASGIAVITFEWHAVLMILLLGWFFLPVYISSGCTTMPEYMKRRFGGQRLQLVIAIQSLIIYILVHIAGQMYAGSLFIKYILGWNIYISSIVILVLTVLYTVAGGLSTVMWTDTIQSVIMIFGSLAITIISLKEVGGYENLKDSYLASAATDVVEVHNRFGNWSCGLPREDFMHLWRDPVSGDLPWPGMVFGLTSIAMFVWCNDQVTVQRTLAAKSMLHAKGGAVFASFLKLTSFALFIIPGLASRVLYPEYIGCASPDVCEAQCGNRLGCSNYAYPKLIVDILPPGAAGVVLAAILSALMSTLTSVMNSASSIFTLDLWTKCRVNAKESEKMIVGRLFVVFLSGLAIGSLPLLENAGEAQFWNYIQSITSYIAPPCSTCFLVAVLWSRATEQGAFWSLVVGLLVGMTRMVLDFIYITPVCGSEDEDTRPSVLVAVHYLHFAIILSVICVCVMVSVSLLTKPCDPDQISGMTWWTHKEVPEQSKDSRVEEEKTPDDAENKADVPENPDVQVHVSAEGWKSWCIYWLCGVHLNKDLEAREVEASKTVRAPPESNSRVKTTLVNASAVLCIIMTSFLFGYFG